MNGGIETTPNGGITATGDGIIYYSLCATIQAARLKAETGMQLTSKMPTVRALRKKWNLSDEIRTYAQVYRVLEDRRLLFLDDPEKKVDILYGKVEREL